MTFPSVRTCPPATCITNEHADALMPQLSCPRPDPLQSHKTLVSTHPRSGQDGGSFRACSLPPAKRNPPAKTMGTGRCSRAQPIPTPVQPALSPPARLANLSNGFPRPVPLPKVDDWMGKILTRCFLERARSVPVPD